MDGALVPAHEGGASAFERSLTPRQPRRSDGLDSILVVGPRLCLRRNSQLAGLVRSAGRAMAAEVGMFRMWSGRTSVSDRLDWAGKVALRDILTISGGAVLVVVVFFPFYQPTQ